ncbi:HIT domain-containing protein [Alsobacter sp. SYSU M60028]|uniref:HIT domain-containing protein n=1 Tax=Alsobacter ponti TaxID=2962936 RepID=A0ABT1L9I8_9HYPH|nr:HIT domain-containing protein [Alsobacter ponti]MCP8938145.1 HIT domain-containing protein [Alsobacter ponti]
MSEPFSLHPQLAGDTAPVGDLGLSRVLLMNDSRFPWLILTPRRAGIREFIELSEPDQATMWREILDVSRVVQALYKPDKLNTCAIGNRVPQLHVHIVARFAADAAWPAPVFGFGTARPYAPDALAAETARLSAALGHL